jgi:membrane peptidoglycan carboxypeptidase
VLKVNQAKFADTCGGPWGGEFKYKNDSGEKGPYTVTRGTAGSVNSVFVQMASKVDQCKIKKLAESIGVHNANGSELSTRPSCSIGGCENNIAPVTAAAAFAAIANKGVFCSPIIVDKIIDRDGNVKDGQNAQCGQSAVSPAVANTAAYAMAGVFTSGTATASNPHDGTTYIGKTGTTDNAVHVWLVGSSTKVSTAVWVGNIKGKQSLRQIAVSGMQAALLRHAIFRPMALAVDKIYPGGAFPPPDPAMLKGSGAIVPDVHGKTQEQAKAEIQLAELNYQKGPKVDSDLPAGESVPKGTTVVVYISNGLAEELPDVTGQDVTSAKNDLNNAGWSNVVGSCETNPTPSPPDLKVYKMDPAPGTVVNKSTVITLHYYGVPSCPVN